MGCDAPGENVRNQIGDTRFLVKLKIITKYIKISVLDVQPYTKKYTKQLNILYIVSDLMWSQWDLILLYIIIQNIQKMYQISCFLHDEICPDSYGGLIGPAEIALCL